jgi:hypothetical protein
MMFAWSNSYNKQMRFKCGVGAIHSVNNTSLVCGDMGSWARKHTGSADTETKETIEEQVKLAKMYYDQLVSDKEAMKKINLDVRKQAQLLGMLFAEHDILTTEQASMIKQQMSRPTYKCTTPGTLWEFYNFVTIALQQSHPKTWMEDQRVLHWFVSETFKFNKVEVKEETVDPNQVDLEDSIAEIEAEQNTTIEEQRAEYWDQQTRIEEGLDHKGGLTNDELAADAEMQEMKTEQVIEEREEEDENPVYDEDQIAERIREDEAAVAEVCDEQEVTYEEAQEYIANQMEADKLDADEADNSVSDENIDNVVKGADFDMDFAVANSDEEEADDDVDFDFA